MNQGRTIALHQSLALIACLKVDDSQCFHTEKFLLVAIIHARTAKKGLHASRELDELGINRWTEPYKLVRGRT